MTWPDLGARSRSDFADRCRRDWDRASVTLSTNDMRLAMETCADTSRVLDTLSCEEITALYAGMD